MATQDIINKHILLECIITEKIKSYERIKPRNYCKRMS